MGDDEIHCHDQERPHRSARGKLRGEAGRDQHGLEHTREHCNDRGEEKRQVRYPGCCDDQDPPEEGDEGREARDLRQSRHGEGEAGQDHRQGLPRESPQGRVLRASACAPPFPPLAPRPSLPPRNLRVISSRLAGGCVLTIFSFLGVFYAVSALAVLGYKYALLTGGSSNGQAVAVLPVLLIFTVPAILVAGFLIARGSRWTDRSRAAGSGGCEEW